MAGYGDVYAPGRARPIDTRTVFGQVMGLVGVTLGFSALGSYIGRHLSGGAGIAFFFVAFACLIGLNFASRRSRGLALTLLFAFGLLLGIATGPVVAYYAKTNPSVVWQAFGATALFIAALGSLGYATRRDLSSWSRVLFLLLLALIVFGLVAVFVRIPHANIIYAVLGLGVFGGYTVFDFNRLRRAQEVDAIPMAASIFIDVFNVFLFFLQIFGGSRD